MKLITPIALIPLIAADGHDMLVDEQDMHDHEMGMWHKVDHMLEEKLGDRYTAEENHFEIDCAEMGFKVEWAHCDETGSEMFDMVTPWGFKESWKWDNEECSWDLKVKQADVYKFTQKMDWEIMGFKPKRNGKLKPNSNLVQGSIVKSVETVEMKLKMQDNTWEYEHEIEMNCEVTQEDDIPMIETKENGSFKMDSLMEAGVEHRFNNWMMHQKQSCMDMEMEMNFMHSVNYDNEDMPFSSASDCMEMKSSWMNHETGEMEEHKMASKNSFEMTSYSHENDNCEMSATLNQYMGESLKELDTETFFMDFSLKINGVSTCMSFMSMMMEDGVDMADLPDCIVEIHMDNIRHMTNWETMEMENLEDIAIYEVIAPSQTEIYNMVETYGGSPVFGMQCNMEELTISGALGDQYEELVVINYEQMNMAHWEMKYFFMFMVHVQMKTNEMIGEWFMSEDYDMSVMKDAMFYYDNEFEMKSQEGINMINDMREQKCDMTIAEYHEHMGLTFKNTMERMVMEKVNKELQFMQTYETQLMEMCWFSWEDHMMVMEMWEAFEPVPMSDSDINSFAQLCCNKYHDGMVEWHQHQIDAVNAWFIGMRQWHKDMADEIYDRLARQDEINAAQVEHFDMVKNLAETEWKCEFDFWLEESQGWPMGSVQDYSSCGNWEVPQIEA